MKKGRKLLLELGMILFVALWFYPVFMIISISLKTNSELLLSPLALPAAFNLENYKSAFEKMNYLQTFANSFILTFLAVLFSVVISAMAGYGIMRAKAGKKLFNKLYVYFVSGLMLPTQLAMVALVLLLKKIHLINSIPGLVCVYLGSLASFSVFLVSGFVKTVPVEIEESAIVDGCPLFRIFWKIVLPLMKPAIVTLIILNSMSVWNDFLSPLIYLNGGGSKTLPLMVYLFRGKYITAWNLLFAALVLTVIPVLIIYFILQKYIISGFTVGAVKG